MQRPAIDEVVYLASKCGVDIEGYIRSGIDVKLRRATERAEVLVQSALAKLEIKKPVDRIRTLQEIMRAFEATQTLTIGAVEEAYMKRSVKSKRRKA